MTTLKNFLIKNEACQDLFDYAKNMTLTEFYNNCNRGDWIIWLFAKTNPNNIKELVLAAAHCVNACKHLLKDERSLRADERSLRAIDAALNFEVYSQEQLKNIYDAADAAWAAADAADAAWAAADAAWAANDALKNPKLLADIAKKHLPLDLWNQEIINN